MKKVSLDSWIQLLGMLGLLGGKRLLKGLVNLA